VTTSAAPHILRSTRRVAELVSAANRETTLAQVGLGVIAVHVLDDNFLQPQPGTSAADHLVSGLVPLGVLLLAAATYSRLRGGLRGSIAILFGAFGITMGAGEAVYYSLKVGPSGDDYTGFLALAAGLLLIGVGVATLWKTRRSSGSLAWRYGRRVLLALGSTLAAYVLLLPFLLSYVFTHAGRAVVAEPNLGAAHEDVSFTTSDGLKLRGWYVPSTNGAAVIAFPGRTGPQRQTRMLVRHGYGVLLFDRRGEGESDGDPNAFGWAMDKDLKAAAAFLQHRPDVDRDRIGGIGLSVGGEMMLQTAAETDAIKAVVSEGAGSRSIREVVEKRAWLDVPTYSVLTAGTALFSNHAPPQNLKQLVSRIAPRSVFFIYSTHGTGGEEKLLNPKYYAAAGEPKAIWEIPESSHVGGIKARPKEYERRVIGFFDRALATNS
jgi:uncharacterized protein